MWLQLTILINVLFLENVLMLEVGEECVPNNKNKDGVCTVITDCEVAISAIQQKNYHSFLRCGFEDLLEVICCPRETATKFGPGRDKKECKAERECRKIMESSTPPLDLHIIGGELASLGEFPHMVAIGYDRGNGYQFDCGGALVSTTYVLTAAHCIINLERVEPEMIRAGVVEIGDEKWHDESDYRVAETITHPNYTHSSKYNDIALLRLDRPVEVTSNLNAACLYTSGEDPAGALTITGWGKISTTQSLRSSMLLKTNVSAVSRERCDPHYTEWRKLPRGISDGQICAGDPNGGHDACQGDSGGPLQVTVGREAQYRLVGVTSFGRGCGSPTPGVYTRVANYLDWIEGHVWPY